MASRDGKKAAAGSKSQQGKGRGAAAVIESVEPRILLAAHATARQLGLLTATPATATVATVKHHRHHAVAAPARSKADRVAARAARAVRNAVRAMPQVQPSQGEAVTASSGSTAYAVNSLATPIDPTLTVTANGGATFSSATVAISQNLHAAEDQLSAPGLTGGTATFTAATGTLTITFTTPATAAQVQTALRGVEYRDVGATNTLDARTVTFTVANASATKVVQPDYSIDTDEQAAVTSAFGLIQNVGQKIAALTATPGLNDTTQVPYTNKTVTDLLYPNSPNLDSNGNPVADWSSSVQPSQIGNYLGLKTSVASTFTAAAGAASLATLSQNVEATLTTLVPGASAVRSLSSTVSSDLKTLTLTLTIANTKGTNQPLDLGQLKTDLGLNLPNPPTISVGGGSDIQVVITVDLNGHTAGVAIPANKVTVNFARLNSLAGFAFDATTEAEIGVIRGQIVDGSGQVGATIPVTLANGGMSRTLDQFAADGSDVSGFGTMSGSANLTLPITASIGGVSATTANTRVVVTDSNIFDTTPPVYTATDFDKLRYFSSLSTDDIINQVLAAGQTLKALGDATTGPLSLSVPFVKDTTLGDLFQVGPVFDRLIGNQINVVQPTLQAAFQDELTDPRLPLSNDTTPKPAAYSSLLAGFTFGVLINNAGAVHTITVPANANRTSLTDLVTDLNTALTSANVAITASDVSNALVFTATDVAIQNFTMVPVATSTAQQNPTAAPADASSLTNGQTYYFTVTGSTSGTVTGTDYYTLNSSIAAAAVHAGILTDGQSGVVKVTLVGSQASLWAETRNGITSGSASNAAAYLIESGENDLQRLGIAPSGTPLTVLERSSGGVATATLPFQADLSSAAKLVITVGTTPHTVTIPDNSRTTLSAALADVQLALVSAGIPATTLAAQLVDASGNVAPATPVVGTSYFLQFYLPTTNTNGTFTLAPVSDAAAYQVLPIGFTSGQVASTPRPTALRTFEDFSNATLFPNLTITPVYDNVANTVTLEFSVTQNMAGTATAADFSFTTAPLTSINASSNTQTFTLPVTTALDFGLEFDISPAKAVSIASGTSTPTNGRLTADAHLTAQLPLDDNYSITVPSAWTTANNNVQDLIGDVNLALSAATGSHGSVNLTTGKLVARSSESGGTNFELITATPTNGGVSLALPSTSNGKLSTDLTLAFVHLGKHYVVTLPASATSANTHPSDLVAELNTALSTAVLDANNNGVADSTESTVSLASTVFFTTTSAAGGAFDPHVQMFTTDTTGATWPTSVSVIAARTDAAVTQLGFDDGAGSDVATSTVSASATGAVAKLRNPTDNHAIVTGTINATIPTFAGTTQYGFNKISFSGAGGTLSLQSSVSLGNGVDETVAQLSNSPATAFTGTLTGANGTGNGTASLILSGLTAASGATIASNATINISIPDLSDPTATVPVALGLPIPVPQATATGTLDTIAPVNFIDGSSTITVTVPQATAAGNTTFDQLAAQFNTALRSATVVTNGVTTTKDVSASYVITNQNGTLLVSSYEQQNNPNYATITFLPTLAAFGEVGQQGSFGPGTVADGLQASVAALDALQAGVPDVSQFKLPLINQTLASLLDIKGNLLTRISNFRNMDVESVSQIATSLAAALSVPSGDVKISYDATNKDYRVDLEIVSAKSTTLPLDISLADYLDLAGTDVPDGLARLVDTGNNSPLQVQIKATTVISLGIDLTDPANPRAFLYGHDDSGVYDMETDGAAHGTSVDYSISINGTDISFSTSVGALGVYVEGGSVSLGGALVTDAGAPAYTFDSDNNVLHLAQQSKNAELQVSLGGTDGGKFYLSPQTGEQDATDATNYTAAFIGTVDVNLPLFTPTEYTNPFTNRSESVYVLGEGHTTVTPGGNVVDLKVTDLDSFANDSLALDAISTGIATVYASSNGTLNSTQQGEVDDFNTQKAAIVANGDVDAFVPDPESADAGVQAPTLLDAIRDPSVLLDGLDSALGLVQSGLQGLDNLNLPVVGPVLGDAVKSILNFRSGWLNDLKHHMRGAGENAFEYAKEEIFNFLGPAGLNILLQDNGIQSVSGMVPATSPDDVTLDFLDADGNKMTGLGGQGADAVEFKIRLGQVLVDTGADIGFNFDSLKPALSLGITGGLTFKLGWDMTLGFGFSLKDGFYLTTDSDPSAQQMELRFDAGLSGKDTGFTVAERSPGLFSIKDADGNWVLGPKNGDGSQSILDVIPVTEEGESVNLNGMTDQQIAATQCEDGQANTPVNEQTYWVVAVDDGNGNLVPAYIDKLGFYRPMSGSDWAAVNGGSTDVNPDMMVQYNQTAPFTAFGSLFFLNLAAVDQIQTGLAPKGDADYYYDSDKTVTSDDRNNADDGVNRNNELPTRVSGSIGVKLMDPSADAGDYVTRPGPTLTGYMVFDGSTPLGGQPVLDDEGDYVPAEHESDGFHRLDLKEGGNPAVLADYEDIGLVTTDESPNRITWSELKDEGLGIFKVTLNAQAVVNLDLTLSVSDNANFPTITADLNLDWQHSFTLVGGKDETSSEEGGGNSEEGESSKEEELALLPEVALNNIRLDLGSFLSKLIKPIAGKINDALAPVDQLLHVINARIPVISDIAGHDVTLTTLLTDFGGGDGEAVAAVIDLTETVGDLANVMANVPANANVYLPLGNFWLAKTSNGPFGQPGMGTTIYYDNSEIHTPSILQRNQSLIANPGAGLNAVTDALGSLDSASTDGNGSGPAFDGGGFDFPLLTNPMTVFKLLMGDDEPLVTFSLPKLHVDLDADIPLIHILIFEVGLHLNLQLSGQLAMGYDTYGLREFSQSHDPSDLLDGFYVSDRANADGTGADVDEFDMHASIGLYGGVDLYLAKAGIEGGFEFDGSINLNDPNNDGKLRVPEMVHLVEYTGNPLDLADIHFSGDVYAKYYYWAGLKIWTPWHTYTITLFQGGSTFAKLQLFDLDREGSDGPPVYGTMASTVDSDGTTYPNTLILNMGDSAAQRISNQDPLNSTDGNENFKVWNDPSNPSTVYVQYLNYRNDYTETYTNVSRVVADGGLGNDSIDASGLNGLPVAFDGGVGNDTISLGSGSGTIPSEIDGGTGNDSITVGGGGKVKIDGDDGDDSLTGGTGTDTLDPGDGNDTIVGGAAGSTTVAFDRSFGTDSVSFNAGATDNILDFTNSSQAITANLSGDASTVISGAGEVTFNLDGTTQILGSEGDDTFNVADPETRNANNGEGLLLRGGPGTDSYNMQGDDLSGVASDGITVHDGRPATSDATIADVKLCSCGCGSIESIDVGDAGSGYLEAPEVIITDPTGSGARAVAGIDANGDVTGIYMISEGSGYTNPTVTLLDPAGHDDSINYSQTTNAPVTLDRSGNGGTDYRITSGGKSINFTGWMSPGTLRPDNYNTTEIENLGFTLPTADLTVNAAVDFQGSFTVKGRRVVQNAPIVADTVGITTDRGLQVTHPIDTTNNGDLLLRVTGKNQPNYTGNFGSATASISGGAITGATVTAAGNYYDFAPTVTARGNGTGSGAELTSSVANGQLTGVTVTNPGNGYLNTPAPQIWIAPPASVQIDSDIGSSTVGSLPGAGDGRGQVSLYADVGAINTDGDVVFPSASHITWGDGDYDYAQNTTLDDVTTANYSGVTGGSGATAQTVIDGDGRVTAINVVNGGSGYTTDLLPSVQIPGGAVATAVVGSNGSITGFHITDPGEGYAVAPAVTIVSNGFGKIIGTDAASTTLNRAHVGSANGALVAVGYYGVGDPDKPLKTDVATLVAQTFAPKASVNVLEKDAVQLGLVDQINGINTIEGDVNIATMTGAIVLGAPKQMTDAGGRLLWQDALKTVPIYVRNPDGSIQYQGGRIQTGQGATTKLTAASIDVHSEITGNGGNLVLQPINPSADIGLNGTTARATGVITDGQLTSLSDFWAGRGYTAAPTVTLTPPGQRAVAFADVLNGELSAVNLEYGGTNYNDDFQPIVTFVGGGINGVTPAHPATATAQYDSSGEVTGFTITDPGSGYVTSPTVNISLPGTQAKVVAVMDGDRVDHFQITDPGSNYVVPPILTITTPFAFTLENNAVSYFQQGFNDIIIGRADGRHTFHAAQATTFKDNVTLRAPDKGGAFMVEALASTAHVNIVGSGSTTHLTADATTISGTTIDINDNVVIDDGVSGQITATDGHIDIFGTGKGMVNATTPGTTAADLTLTAQTDVAVEGAIGSTSPIRNLTITAQTGNVSLAQTTITGTLHITRGQNVNLADLNIGGDLIIDQGATVTFSGAVHVGGNLTISQASAVTFTGAVTVGGNFHIPQTGGLTFSNALTVTGNFTVDNAADVVFTGNAQVNGNLLITLANTVSFNGTLNVGGTLTLPQSQSVIFGHNVSATTTAIGTAANPTNIGQVTFASTARYDGSGTVSVYSDGSVIFGAAVGHATVPTSMTLYSNSGDVSFQGTTNVNDGITVLKDRHTTFADDVTAGSLTVVNGTGDVRLQGAANLGTLDVTNSGLFQTVHALNITQGNATITADNVDFTGGSGTVIFTGSGSSILTIKPRTVSRQITIGSPPGVFTSLDLSDADLAAIAPGFADVVIGDASAGTGLVTIGSVGSQQGAGNSQWVNPTDIYGGAINVVQAMDITNLATHFNMVARTGNITINGKINGTAAERNDLLTMNALAGSIVLNQSIWANNEIHLDVAGAVSQLSTAPLYTTGLRVTAGGTADLSTANNDVTSVTIKSTTGAAKFRDDNGFDLNTVDGQQGITSLTGGATLLSNGPVTISQPIHSQSLTLGGNGGAYAINANVNTTGAITSAATTTVAINAVTLDSTTGGMNFGGPVTLAGAPTLASHGGDITFASTLDGAQNLTLQPVGGSVTFTGAVGAITPLNDVVITSPLNVTTSAPFNALGLAVTGGTGTVTFGAATNVGTDGVQLHTLNLAVNGAVISQGEVHVDANGSVTEGTTGTIKTPGLRITANNGNIDLSAGNNDASVATFKSGGYVKFRDDQTSVIGTVDGQSGITAPGAVTLTTNGHISVNQPINALRLSETGTGLVSLNASSNLTGSITSSATTSTEINAVTLDSTSGGINLAGPVVLTGTPTLNSHGADMTFGSTLDGGYNLLLNPIGGSVTFTGAVGALTPLGVVTIASPLNTTMNAFNASQFTVNGATGDVTFNGAANIGSGGIQLHAVNVTANAVVHSTGEIHVDANGYVTESAAGSLQTPGLRVTALNGNVDLSAGNNDAAVATIKSGGIAKFRDDQTSTIGTVDGQSGIVAPGNVSLLTAGHITVAQPVSGARLAEYGTGTVTWNAAAHMTNAITSSSTLTSDLGAVTLDSLTGGINLSGPVTLSGAPVLASHGSDITLGSTVDGNQNLTLQPANGNVTFSGTVGGITPIGILTITSPHSTSFAAIFASQLSLTGGTGDATFNGAATVGLGGIQIHAANITANAVVASTGEIHLDSTAAVTESAAGGFKTPGLRVTALSGDVDLSTGNNDATVVTIKSGGVAKFHDDQTSTVGTVDGQSGIVAPGNVALLTNGHITVAQAVSGAQLAETGTGTVTWNAPASMTGAVTTAAGTTTELGNVTIDSLTGGMTFNGPVSLTGAPTLASHGGALLFNNTVDGDNDLVLQPAGGAVTFAATVGGVTPISDLTITSPAATIFNAISADGIALTGGTGDATFNGAAAIGSDGIQIHAVNITANAVVQSTGEIHLDAGNDVTESAAGSFQTPGLRVTSTGDTDLSAGNNDAAVVSISSGGVAKWHDDQTSTVGTVNGQSGIVALGNVALQTNGHIIVAQPVSGFRLTETGAGTVTWNANATMGSAITGASTLTTEIGNVTLASQAGNIDLSGPVSLTGDATLTSNGGDIDFDSTVDGHHALTLEPADGNVSFNGAVGSLTPIGVLTITSPTATNFNALAADQLTVTGGLGDATFAGTASVGTGGIQIHAVDVIANAPVSSTGEIHLDTSGYVTESAAGSFTTPGMRVTAVGNIDLSAGANNTTSFTASSGGLVKYHNDNTSTVGTVDNQSGITAAGSVSLQTNGHIIVAQPVSGFRLIETGTGTVSFNANATLRSAITSTSTLSTEVGNVTLSSLNGGIDLSGPVSLTGDATLVSTGGDIDFDSTVDGHHALTLQPAGGNVNFNGAVGSTTALGVLTITSPTAANFSALATDQVVVTGGLGDVTFAGIATVGIGGIQIHAVDVIANAPVSSTGEIHLDTSGYVTESAAGSFAAPGMRVTALGNVDLSAGTNNTAIFTASSGGIVKYRNDNTSSVGTVDGQSGITAAGSVVLLTGGTITVDQPVSGYRLSEYGHGTVTWNANAHMTGAVTSGTTLTTNLNGVTLDTTTGGINLTGPTVLLANSTLASHAGNIALATLAGGGFNLNLQPAGGNVTLNGAAGNVGILTITSPAATTLSTLGANQLVVTGGTGALTFSGAATLGSGGAQITTASVVDNALVTSAGNIHLNTTGTVTQSATGGFQTPGLRITSGGDTDLSAGNNNATVVSIQSGGVAKLNDDHTASVGTVDGQAGIAATGAVVLSTDGTIEVDQPIAGASLTLNGTGDVTFDAGATVTGPITSAATTSVDLHGVTLSSSAGGITIAGPLTLDGDSVIASHGGDVNLTGTVDGAQMLTVRALGGDVTFGAAVGGATPLTSLVITNAGDVAFNGALNAGTLTETAGTGATSFGDVVTLGSGGANVTAGTIDVAKTFTAGGPLLLTAAGSLTLETASSLNALNAANIVLTGSTLAIQSGVHSITGTGLVVLQPYAVSTGMTLGSTLVSVRNRLRVSSPVGFTISQGTIEALGTSFQRLLIGRGHLGGYDSGAIANAPVAIHGLVFHTPTLIRAEGTSADITIDGPVTTDTANDNLAIDAGRDLNVNANVTNNVSGGITLTAGRNLNIASSAATQISTPNGDITLEGHGVAVGSAGFAATIIASHGNVIGKVDSAGPTDVGAFTQANARTAVYASGNVDIGATDAAHRPATLSLAGTIIATGSVLTHSSGDTTLNNFRFRGGTSVAVLADGNLTAASGTVIAPARRIALTANADANRTGKSSIAKTVLLSNSVAQPLTVAFNKYVPDTVHKAVSGDVVFTLTNTGAATLNTTVTVRVWSSTDATFAPDDSVVGTATFTVKNLRGGRSQQFSLPVADFPSSRFATRHPYVFVEMLPYGPTVPANAQPFGTGDANIAVGTIIIGSAAPRASKAA